MISPTRPRSTASGLQITRVRSMEGEELAARRSTRLLARPGRRGPRPTTYSDPVTRIRSSSPAGGLGPRRPPRPPTRSPRLAHPSSAGGGRHLVGGHALGATAAGRRRPGGPCWRSRASQHLVGVLALQHADDQDPRAGVAELLVDGGRRARAPGTFLAPSRTTSGRRPTTSSRPGERTVAAASATRSSSSGAPKKASAATRASTKLSAWWRPCRARNTSS